MSKTAPAWRLRDLRRFGAGIVSGRMGISEWPPALWDLVDQIGVGNLHRDQRAAERKMRLLDRLISRFGPDADILAVAAELADEQTLRQSAERTDHVIGKDAPITDSAGTMEDAAHGGDGNSGEVQHAAETAAADQTRAPTDTHLNGADDDALGGPSDHEDDARESGDVPSCRGADGHGAEKATEGEMGAPGRDGGPPDGDTGRAEGGLPPARSSDGAGCGHGQAGRLSEDAGALAVPTQEAIRARLEAARIAAVIERARGIAMRSAPSPQWDGRRVVRELVSRQCRMHRMRRDQPKPTGVLVLADVSGSCDWIADRTWPIAVAIAQARPFLYATTTGQYGMMEGSIDPQDIIGRNARAINKCAPIVGQIGHGDDVEGWRALRDAGISHLLVLGDNHGILGYRCAAMAGIIVWMVNPNPDLAPSVQDRARYLAGYAEVNQRDIADGVARAIGSI